MTKEEFDTTQFKAKMKSRCVDDTYIIKGVDFGEGTVWISRKGREAGFWASYKHIEIIK